MEYINHLWEDYDTLRHDKEAKAKQVHLLYGSRLYEGKNGGEYCFVPTKRIEMMEKSVHDSYGRIKTADHKVSICNEIYYTSKIEGSHTTYKRTVELHDGKPVNHDDYFSEMMIKGGFEATGYLNRHGNVINEDVLLNMWNILVDGCCDNEDLRGPKYRTGDVGVGNHTGIRPALLDEVMSYWIDYYNSNELDDHPFVKASLLHVSYERIHPFCDGNGRSGRLLATNYLIGRGFDKCRAISFARDIAIHSNAYYAALDACDNPYFDCTPFIEFMMKSYRNTMQDILYKAPSKENVPVPERKSASKRVPGKDGTAPPETPDRDDGRGDPQP